jgi:hypothetical protein
MALQPEALCKFSGSHVAVEAIVHGTMPLLSFTDFADRMFMPDGRFEPPLAHAPEASIGSTPYLSGTFGRLAEAFMVASAFLSIEPLQKKALGEGVSHPCNFEHTIQATVVGKTDKASFMLHARVAAHDISSFLLDPR